MEFLITLCFMCFGIIIGFGIPVALAYFVYKDAEKNNVENSIAWALVTFFTGVIGLLIYFFAIKPAAEQKRAVEANNTSEVKTHDVNEENEGPISKTK